MGFAFFINSLFEHQADRYPPAGHSSSSSPVRSSSPAPEPPRRD
jgi:hypothetical protein